MSIKRKNSFSSFDYKEEKATRTYLEVRNRFDLVLHNNLNFVIILSDFHLKASLKDPPKSLTHKNCIILMLDLSCFAAISLVSFAILVLTK